jgi:diphthamide synthase (EF-2-diphthine--ammonia ligase)
MQLARNLGLESLHAVWKKSWLEILDEVCLQELLVGIS